VRASNDTAVQDCEAKGRCPLPFLYPQFPPALLFELFDDGTDGKVFSFAFTSSCAHRRCSTLLTRSLVLNSPPCPPMKRVSEPIQCGPRCSSRCAISFPGWARGLVMVSARSSIGRGGPNSPLLSSPLSSPSLLILSCPSHSTASLLWAFPKAQHSQTCLIGQLFPADV